MQELFIVCQEEDNVLGGFRRLVKGQGTHPLENGQG